MNIFCVRADFGRYTQHFLDGSYIGIGWLPDHDLSAITCREELYSLYKAVYPNDKSPVVIGQQVGQIARFLLEIQEGDYVITPAANTEYIYKISTNCSPLIKPIRGNPCSTAISFALS